MQTCMPGTWEVLSDISNSNNLNNCHYCYYIIMSFHSAPLAIPALGQRGQGSGASPPLAVLYTGIKHAWKSNHSFLKVIIVDPEI